MLDYRIFKMCYYEEYDTFDIKFCTCMAYNIKSAPPPTKVHKTTFIKNKYNCKKLYCSNPSSSFAYVQSFFLQIPFMLIYDCLKNSNVITTGRNLWLLAKEWFNSWMWQGGG